MKQASEKFPTVPPPKPSTIAALQPMEPPKTVPPINISVINEPTDTAGQAKMKNFAHMSPTTQWRIEKGLEKAAN